MNVKRALQSIADAQYGYFSAQQAKNAGYAQQHHTYHVGCGNWEKVDRGVFRLPGYDNTLESEFVRWSLWAKGRAPDRRVTISHESALFYYRLTVERPLLVHLSVPPQQLNKSELEGCEFHRQELQDAEVVVRPGFQLTTPVRTLLDMKPMLILTARWGETVRLALQNRLIDECAAGELLGEVLFRQMLRAQPAWAAAEYAGAASGMAGQAGGTWRGSPTMRQVEGPVRMRQGGGSVWQAPNRSFTLVEMLVVIAVIAILASLLMPSLTKALESTRGVNCLNNLRQMGMTLPMYAEGNAGYMPTPYLDTTGMCWWWLNSRYDPYTDLRGMARVLPFMCPSWNGGTMGTTTSGLWLAGTYWSYSISYPYCGGSTNLSVRYSYLNRYPNTLLLFDNRPQSATSFQTWAAIGSTPDKPSISNIINLMTNSEPSAWRHNGSKASMLFADFHAKLNDPGELTNANVAPPTLP